MVERVDAEYGHDPVERLHLLLRQVRRGEHREGLQVVQLSGARQYVAEQQYAQVHRADPVVDDRQMDADAHEVAVRRGKLHEVARAGVSDTQHAAEASRGDLRYGGSRQMKPIGP